MAPSIAKSLRRRMLATVVLFVVCAVSFVGALALLYGWLVPGLIDWWSHRYGMSADVGMFAVLALGGVILWLAIGTAKNFFASPLTETNAKEVTSEDRPELHGAVRRLATQADVPKPDVAVVRSSVPNAFTTGLAPSSSTVVVSEGLLETLTDDEVEAVLAHEIAHITNRDGAVMTIGYLLPAASFAVAKALTSPFESPERPGFEIDDDARQETDDDKPETVPGSVGDGTSSSSELSGSLHGSGSSGSASSGGVWTSATSGDSDGDTGKALIVLLAILVLTAILTFAISMFFWVFSYFTLLLLARTREYAADWGAVELTGNPEAFVNALTKLDDEMDGVPLTDLREMDGAVETLYIMPLRRGIHGFRDVVLLSDDLFPRTHPDTEKRIDRILEASQDQ